jgi:hypothetical protein
MAEHLYGAVLPSDTYGVIRLKLMGCVVAIVQRFYAVDNVDSLMSRSDLLCIAHVGGILKSSRQRFYSDMFNILDIVDVDFKLGQLIKAKLPVLISPTPRQPGRLTSAAK